MTILFRNEDTSPSIVTMLLAVVSGILQAGGLDIMKLLMSDLNEDIDRINVKVTCSIIYPCWRGNSVVKRPRH